MAQTGSNFSSRLCGHRRSRRGRWGFAATASTADLGNLVVGIMQDSHWQHAASTWLFDMFMLTVLAALFAGVARWRLRLGAG